MNVNHRIVTIRFSGPKGRVMEVPLLPEEYEELFGRGERLRIMKLQQEQEHLRREQERKRRQEEAEKLRQQRFGGGTYSETFFINWNNFDGLFNGFFSTAEAGSSYSHTPPRTEYKTTKSSTQNREGALIRLMEIADEKSREVPLKRLIMRAQRRAHPDTGGSHELWIEVEQLVKRVSN